MAELWCEVMSRVTGGCGGPPLIAYVWAKKLCAMGSTGDAYHPPVLLSHVTGGCDGPSLDVKLSTSLFKIPSPIGGLRGVGFDGDLDHHRFRTPA